MNKEQLNTFEHSFIETSDSCPKCGNPLVTKQENGNTIKRCITESFDLATQKVTACGFIKTL